MHISYMHNRAVNGKFGSGNAIAGTGERVCRYRGSI